MKKFWKALGLTALAAAVIPYRVRKDEETGEKSLEALLWQVSRRPGDAEDKDIVDISLGFKSPFQAAREEAELFTDDPQEAVLFADDEPEAAVVEAPAAPTVEEASAEETEEEPTVTEADFDPEA